MDYFIMIIAGLLAGIATGLVGLSAAAIIVPLYSTVLGMDPYIAVGISLSSDVLASGMSSITYARNKNIDIKNGIYMMISVLIFTVISSYLSSLLNTDSIGSFMNVIAIVLGINFLRKNHQETKPLNEKQQSHKKLKSVIWGVLVGCICGYIGAGGGVMLLVVLTSILGYELKAAVGTSVFIMTFTALTGAVSHIVISPPEIIPLILSVTSAVVGAFIAARYANKVPVSRLNNVVGIFMILFGIMLTGVKQLA
jgi:hypothetical protein